METAGAVPGRCLPWPQAAAQARSGSVRPAGFSLVEFLLAAFILAVGLLGLTALQVATVRSSGWTGARMTAAALANNALESALAEARRVFLGRGAGPDGPTEGPGPRRFTAPGSGPWVERFDRDGLPPGTRPPFFTVTLIRAAQTPLPPDSAAPGADPPLEARAFQVTVVWAEGAPALPRSLTLNRIIAY